MPAKYVSLDIETAGRQPEAHSVLEIAAVAETDWVTPVEELPSLRLLIAHEFIAGEPAALAMNLRLINELALKAPSVSAAFAVERLARFVNEVREPGKKVTLAGKNLDGFDLRFLERLPKWDSLVGCMLRHRVLDVGCLWFDPATDEAIPDTAECLRRAGLTNDRPHEALEDARTVVKLIRRAYARDRFPAPIPALT